MLVWPWRRYDRLRRWPPTEARVHRDPVAPVEPSAGARQKKSQRHTDKGLAVHSFATLMVELSTHCRHRCQLKSEPDSPAIVQDTEPSPLQALRIPLGPVTGTRPWERPSV
ncbi:MAG TPA: hypothetical protein VFL97_09115 [Nitrococcus sp.]|nr:hypothetical protein [Nitrococcus sp.]